MPDKPIITAPRPSRMFVENGCAQLFLPGVSCGKLPEIFCRDAHFLGNLADGISVQVEIPFRHVHLYLFLCLKCNDRMAVLITQVHSYRCDEVLRDFSLFILWLPDSFRPEVE